MTKLTDIKRMWKLVGSVESYTLRAYRETLWLSENLQKCEEASPNKPPFAINYLEYYDSHEPVTSWIIRHIFAYIYNGHHPFFESFARTFLQRVGFKEEWIDAPIIDKDHETRGIDILVRDKRYAIIIENKLRGADFQLNQLARYIATMRNEGYSEDQIYVVVLPKNEISNDDLWESVWKLPKDWQSTNKSRKCRVDDHTCWCDYKGYKPKNHCEHCESLYDIFRERTIFLHKELAEWLYNCAVNNKVGLPDEELSKQYVLISAALQFVDYLNYLYQTRENDKFKMDIHNFLCEELKLESHSVLDQLSIVENKKGIVEELAEKLDDLYWDKIDEYITEMGRKYQIHLVRKEGNQFYFHYDMKIGGRSLIVSLDKETNADGDFCQIETTDKDKLPKIVANDFEISEELNDKDNRSDCIWKYDSYKESMLRFDRVLGRLLDIQNRKQTIT